jgi:CHAD domain-containing protein/adenylate cyclase class IV
MSHSGVSEREIKFRVPEDRDPVQIRDVIEAVGFRLEPTGTIAHVDRYLDTDDWDLYRAGLALRLRDEAGRVRLEAKSIASTSPDMLERTEWSQDAPVGDPPWEALDPGPVAGLLQPLQGLRVLERLQVRASITNDRECFRWMRGDSVIGLLTVDHVTAPPTSFREIELELKNGAEEALGQVRSAVHEQLGLEQEDRTKLAAALEAAGVRLPERDERAFALNPADRLLDVAHKIFGRHLGRLLWNEPGSRLGIDSEHVHDMRVAARRLRTALEVVASGYPDTVREDFETDLRWIGRRLGRVRDLDVALDRLVEMERDAASFERPALRIFRQSLEVRRAGRRLRLVERLDSERFGVFLVKARTWIEAGPPGAATVPEGVMPAYAAAPRIIGRWMDAMREAYDVALRTMEPEDLHSLRIAAKRARYAYEYFAELEGPLAQRRAKRIAGLQDFLGDHRDSVELLRRMRRYARSVPQEDRELVLGTGSLLGHIERSVRMRRSDLRDHWERAMADG